MGTLTLVMGILLSQTARATPREDVIGHALTCGAAVLKFAGPDAAAATLDGRPVTVTWDEAGQSARVIDRELAREDDTFILGDEVCTID